MYFGESTHDFHKILKETNPKKEQTIALLILNTVQQNFDNYTDFFPLFK